MIRHRFARAADIDQFYGERPTQTLQAIAIELDGKVVAVIGLAREANCFQAFSQYRPELAPHLKSMGVLRAIKAAQKMFNTVPLPVVAKSEGTGLLERMGFQHLQGDYLWLH